MNPTPYANVRKGIFDGNEWANLTANQMHFAITYGQDILFRDVDEESARAFLNAHEITPGQSAAEKAMDQFNNNQGISAAKDLLQKEHFDNSTIFERAKKDLEADRLKVLAK